MLKKEGILTPKDVRDSPETLVSNHPMPRNNQEDELIWNHHILGHDFGGNCVESD